MNASNNAPATIETISETLKEEFAYHLAEYRKTGEDYSKNHASAFAKVIKTAEICGTLDELKTSCLTAFKGYLKAFKNDSCDFYYHYALATEKAARICGASDAEIDAAKA